MEKLKLLEIAKYTNGICDSDKSVSSFTINSKEITPDSIFIAVKGENFDGNTFAVDAVIGGAKAVMCEKDIGFENQIIVKDSNKALLDMACGYKNRFSDLKTVAVTGSVGKTTTKEMIFSVLNQVDKTHKNEGNLNNHIGVPKTLLNLDKTHKYAVIEMGMNHFGEIETLSNVVQPDIGVITNIGISHIEFLGSREGILKAKLEILSGLRDILILNYDEPLLRGVKTDKKVMYYSINDENADLYCKDIKEYDKYITYTAVYGDREIDIILSAVGKHNISNSLCAVLVGICIGATDEQIKTGLETFENAKMRQNIISHYGYTLIEDCYNASPDSMKASIDVLCSVKANKKICVLGAMGELGNFTKQAHKEIFEYAECKCDDIYLYGEAFSEFSSEKAKYYNDKTKLAEDLIEHSATGDAILFKGSRLMKIEDVLKIFIKEE